MNSNINIERSGLPSAYAQHCLLAIVFLGQQRLYLAMVRTLENFEITFRRKLLR
jgi:hypothetical protein